MPRPRSQPDTRHPPTTHTRSYTYTRAPTHPVGHSGSAPRRRPQLCEHAGEHVQGTGGDVAEDDAWGGGRRRRRRGEESRGWGQGQRQEGVRAGGMCSRRRAGGEGRTGVWERRALPNTRTAVKGCERPHSPIHFHSRARMRLAAPAPDTAPDATAGGALSPCHPRSPPPGPPPSPPLTHRRPR